MSNLASIPHPVMGTTRNYHRYITALLTPYQGAITKGGIDLEVTLKPKNQKHGLGFGVYVVGRLGFGAHTSG